MRKTNKASHAIKASLIVLIIVGVMASSGCGKARLEGTKWSLEGWPDNTLNPVNFDITAVFSDGKISGRSAVNNYSGTYEASMLGSFSLGTLSHTEMASSESSMHAEEIYLKFLSQAQKYRIDNGRLVLYDASDNELLVFAAVK